MRVLILSQYYDPEPIPKPAELALALTERGHSVEVVTGFPHYPTGSLYPGFRLAALRRDAIHGIRVTRTYEFPYHGKRIVGRLANFLSFLISAPLGGLVSTRPDVLYVRHPPLTLGVAAWLISILRRVPFVYDVQDIWPESILVSGLMRDGWLVRAMSRLERFVYRRAGHLLVVTEGAKENLIRKGVPAGKISVLPNWIDEELFGQADEAARCRVRREHGWQDRFVVLFAGNIGLVQALETVVTAAGQWESDEKPLFVLIGDGVEKDRLQALVAQRGLAAKVQFMDRQPMEKMPELMAAADGLLVHLKRSELADYVIPTKTQAYLAAGKPILMAMEGAAAELVREARAGLVVPPEDPAALVAAIRALQAMQAADLAAMGERGRQYLRMNLARDRVIPRYEEILQRAARPQRFAAPSHESAVKNVR